MKNKVHPLASPSDALSVLTLLPASVISLIALLSHDDRQVLAYMLTRSLKSNDLISSPDFPAKGNQKPRPCFDVHGRKSPPLFDCDCFHCYTSFWFRWDSSPNRELIHQAIEAFEDHLSKGEQSGKGRRRDKTGRRKIRSAAVESPEKLDTVVESAVAAEDPGGRRGEEENFKLVAAPPAGRSHKGWLGKCCRT